VFSAHKSSAGGTQLHHCRCTGNRGRARESK
jgi:hypothetical protein